jgi:hypothetical protein
MVPGAYKLKAQGSKQSKNYSLSIPSTFSFDLSARIAMGSTPDSWNRSINNTKIRTVGEWN